MGEWGSLPAEETEETKASGLRKGGVVRLEGKQTEAGVARTGDEVDYRDWVIEVSEGHSHKERQKLTCNSFAVGWLLC